MSWSPTTEGTLLLGGRWSGATAEVVKQDGSTETSFELKYDTWSVTNALVSQSHFPLNPDV